MDDSTVFDDFVICTSQNVAMRSAKPMRNDLKCSLYPNPAIDKATLLYELPENKIGKFELVTCRLKEGRNTLNLDLSNVSDGLYLYKAIINDVVMDADRILINK